MPLQHLRVVGWCSGTCCLTMCPCGYRNQNTQQHRHLKQDSINKAEGRLVARHEPCAHLAGLLNTPGLHGSAGAPTHLHALPSAPHPDRLVQRGGHNVALGSHQHGRDLPGRHSMVVCRCSNLAGFAELLKTSTARIQKIDVYARRLPHAGGRPQSAGPQTNRCRLDPCVASRHVRLRHVLGGSSTPPV